MSDNEHAPATSSSEEEAIPTPTSEDGTVTSPTSDAEVPNKPQTLPRSDWQFAFGPQKWYWVRVGNAWRFVRSNKSNWDDISIQDPYWVAFKHTTGFLLGGKDDDGEPKVYHSWNDSHLIRADEADDFVKSREAYKHLHQWLDAKQLEDTSVSIGPKGSYFARCGPSWISHQLPKDLMTKLERNKDKFTPMQVALGLHGSWIVLWSDGDVSWNLRNSYPTLAESNALVGGVGQVVFVALSPYQEDDCFIAGEDSCYFNANLESKKEGKEIQKLLTDYMQMRAKINDTTFNARVKTGSKTQIGNITPNSFEILASDSLLETWRARRDWMMKRDKIALMGAGAVGVGMVTKLAGAGPLRGVAWFATGIGAGLILHDIVDVLRPSR